jgi:predicted transcriptional regulator
MKTGEACIRNVACIESDATIREAARRMRLHNVGDLVVLGIGRERSISPTAIWSWKSSMGIRPRSGRVG